MVSALASGLNGSGASPSREHCVVYLGKILYFHSINGYSLLAILMLGVTQRWGVTLRTHAGVNRNIPSRFMLRKTG